jgi:hypothetical protein
VRAQRGHDGRAGRERFGTLERRDLVEQALRITRRALRQAQSRQEAQRECLVDHLSGDLVVVGDQHERRPRGVHVAAGPRRLRDCQPGGTPVNLRERENHDSAAAPAGIARDVTARRPPGRLVQNMPLV